MRHIFLFVLLFSTVAADAQFVASTGSFKSMNDLKAQKGTNWTIATIIGKDSITDHQFGSYYWNDTCTSSSDNDNIVAVTGVATGRWIRLNNARTYFVRNVDGLTLGNTLLFTTGPAMFGRFIVLNAFLVPKTVAGTAIISPIINIGYTASNYNDISSSFTLLGTLAVNATVFPSLVSNRSTVPNVTGIYVRVATNGTGYTTFKFDVYIQGVYESL